MSGSSPNHDAELRGLQQTALWVCGGIAARFGAVEMERRFKSFTSRGRSVKQARKLLWDVTLPAVLYGSAGCG